MIQATERNVCGFTVGDERCFAAAERAMFRALLGDLRRRFRGQHEPRCEDDNDYWPECRCGHDEMWARVDTVLRRG